MTSQEFDGAFTKEHLEELLKEVFRDIRTLFEYIKTFSPSDIDTQKVSQKELALFPLPKEIGYEFCSTVSHLLVIRKVHETDLRAACDEASKAGRHITRALLDYVKYHALRGTGVVHPIISTGKIIQARLAECAGIGTNHNGAMAKYRELLELHYGKKFNPEEPKINAVKLTFNAQLSSELERFFRLEAAFSGLTCEKLNEVLSAFLRLFTLPVDYFPLLVGLNQYIATRILDKLMSLYGDFLHQHAATSPAIADWIIQFRAMRAATSPEKSNQMVVGVSESLMQIIIERAESMCPSK